MALVTAPLWSLAFRLLVAYLSIVSASFNSVDFNNATTTPVSSSVLSQNAAATSTFSTTSVSSNSDSPNLTTTEDNFSSCTLITPSPSYWFPTWAFQAAYQVGDPCKFQYCRSSLNAKFPNSDALGSLRKTITGVYATSTVIQTVVTQSNQTLTSNSTEWYDTNGPITLSSLAAWWGNSWNEPCCDVCHISAGTIDLRYWPTSPPTPEAATIVEDGYTFRYPSIYWAFDTIAAQDGCSTIGSDHSNQTLAFDPSEISSVSPIPGLVSGSSGMVLGTYSIDWEAFYKQDCTSATGYTYSLGDPSNMDPWDYDPCNPYIAIPSDFATRVDPAWGSSCINDNGPYGYYDPPWALQSQSGLMPEPSTQSFPFTAEPASQGSTPIAPTVTPTITPVVPPSVSSVFSPLFTSTILRDSAPTSDVPDYLKSPPDDPPSNSPGPTDISNPPPDITIDPSGNIVLSSSTLTPGAAITISSSITISIATDSAIYVDNTLVGPNLSPPPPTAGQAITHAAPQSAGLITIGDSTLTAIIATASSANVVVLGPGITLSAGGSAATLNGVAISIAPGDAIIIGGTKTVIPSTTATPLGAILTLGRSTITAIASAISGSAVLILAPGTTLIAGGSPITIDGTPLTLNPSGGIVAGGTTTFLPSSLPPSATSTALLTLGASTITAIASILAGAPTVVLGPGTTLYAGGPPATVDGVPISVVPGGGIVIGGTTTIIPSAVPTSTGGGGEVAIWISKLLYGGIATTATSYTATSKSEGGAAATSSDMAYWFSIALDSGIGNGADPSQSSTRNGSMTRTWPLTRSRSGKRSSVTETSRTTGSSDSTASGTQTAAPAGLQTNAATGNLLEEAQGVGYLWVWCGVWVMNTLWWAG